MEEGIWERIRRIKTAGAITALAKEIEFEVSRGNFGIARETAGEIAVTAQKYIDTGE